MANHDQDYDLVTARQRAASMVDRAAFAIGQQVYARISDDRGLVTGYIVRPGAIQYLVQWPDGEEAHYVFTLSDSPAYGGSAS